MPVEAFVLEPGPSRDPLGRVELDGEGGDALEELRAQAFHAFYTQCRVVDEEEPELSRARLLLLEATRVVLARTLGLMSISAPERM